MRNVIVAEFSDSNSTTTKRLTRKDYGQILKFEGIDLPASYEVHFSNIKTNDGTAKTQIGNSDGVLIPDEYLLTGLTIYAWIFLHEGNDDGETCYTVKIPVDSKPSVSPSQPTPVQQDVITQTIAALNEAVETTAEDSAAAVAAKEAIQNMAVSSTTLDSNQTATVEKIVDEETGAVELAFGIPHGYKGDTGTIYTPSVSDEGVISWTNDGDLDNPEPVNIKGQKGDTGATPQMTVGDVITLPPGSGVTIEITGSDTNPVLNIGIPKGDKGEHGDAFHIVKTYPTILHMNDDYNNPNIAIGEFVMITSDVEDPDNAKVYVKGDHQYNFVVDMSGSAGLKGDTGNGISSISYNQDYSLTFYYTNGSSYTTPSIRGEAGLAIMSPMTAGPDYEITITDGAAGRAMTSYEVELKPVQNGTGDPSPSNYRPLTGWRQVAVYHGGENRANPVEYSYIFGTNTGTIYRGSYDFVSTRLVSSGSVYYITGYMDFTLRTVYSSNNVVRYRYFETTLTESSVRSINIDAYNTHGDVCTHYKVSSSLANSNNTIYYYNHKICIRDDRFTNVADFQAYLREQMLDGTDVVYCGTRVTPSEYYLSDPNEIETLYGINTFWCSDGKISISYDADAKIYIEEHTNGFAAKADTVLDTTLSRGRRANSTVGYGSFAFGGDVTASGTFSHAEGAGTTASGVEAHAEGLSSTASGDFSHAEGSGTTASGNSSHAEGTSNIASGVYSHTEGSGTTASSNCAHAEGYQTTASDFNSHAEGSVTTASGSNSHAEGYGSKAKAQASHAEGTYTIAAANSQHVVGMYNVEDTYDNWPEWSANTHYYPGDRVKRTTSDTVYGYTCKTENTDSTFTPSNWNADNTNKRNFVEIVGIGDSDSNRANGRTLDWQGNERVAGDLYVHANTDGTGGSKVASISDLDGFASKSDTVLDTTLSHGRVANTTVGQNSVAYGYNVTASGDNSQAFGGTTTASGTNSHAEGVSTVASGVNSHAEGGGAIASNTNAHAEGGSTTASGANSHAEGAGSQATGHQSHAEGAGTISSGDYSHAEGAATTASAMYSHTEGAGTTASGMYAHAEGQNTIAAGESQHVVGAYNIEDSYDSTNWPVWAAYTHYEVGDKVQLFVNNVVHGYICKTENTDSSFDSSKWVDQNGRMNYAEIVGNGFNNARSNARTLDWQGNEYLAGDVYVGCDDNSTGGTKLAKVTDIPTVPVQDVQVNGVSVLSNGVANVPLANTTNAGAVIIGSGLVLNSSNKLSTNTAGTATIKQGTNTNQPIAPATQHASTFYGLAKAAGDTSQSASDNAVGTYTADALKKIRMMLGIPNAAWEYINEVTVSEDSELIEVTTDSNGQAFKLKKMIALFSAGPSTTGTRDGFYTLLTGTIINSQNQLQSNAVITSSAWQYSTATSNMFAKAIVEANYPAPISMINFVSTISDSSGNPIGMPKSVICMYLSSFRVYQSGPTKSLVPAGAKLTVYGIRYDE